MAEIIRTIETDDGNTKKVHELGMSAKNLNEINISESTDETGEFLKYIILDAGSATVLID